MIFKSIEILRSNIRWIGFSFGVFLLGTFISYSFADFRLDIILEEQLKSLEELGKQVYEGPWLQGVLLIFLNNLRASLFLMILGILAGLPTFLGIFLNGALLGGLMKSLTLEGLPVMPFIVFGILPHGIVELPAFFISTAFGFKLGYYFLFPFSGLGRLKSASRVAKEFGYLLPLIIILLAVAAAIEVLLTPSFLSLIEGTYELEIPDF